MIGAVVLAAGESRRMGRPKLLLPWGSGTVLGSAVAAVLAAPIETVAVVLGAGAEAVGEALAPWRDEARVLRVENRRYAEGMLTSVQAGVAALPKGCTAFLLVLGDHPAVPAAVASALIEAARAEPGAIIIPTHAGRRGHPVLFPLTLRDEILALAPSEGLRAVQQAHPEAVRLLPVADPGILVDLDTPEDYQRLRPPETTAPGTDF